MALQIGGPPLPSLPLPEGVGGDLGPGAAPGIDPGVIDPGLPIPPEGLAPELPPQDIEVPAPDLGAEEEALDPNKVDPILASYKHPEMGPFLCANCRFFTEDNSCKIVAGFIDEAGICNNFTPPDEGAEDPEALIAEAQELQTQSELPLGEPVSGLQIGDGLPEEELPIPPGIV